MAKYVVTFPGCHDKVCDTYADAVTQKGFKEIYCAPDGEKKWRSTWPNAECDCWAWYMGKPYRTHFVPRYGNGAFYFKDHLETDTREFLPAARVTGWLPMDWFRSIAPDDEDMRRWQLEDEFGDRGDDYDYGDPNEI